MDYALKSVVDPNTTLHTCKGKWTKNLIEEGNVENGTKANNTCHLPVYPYNYNLKTMDPNDCTNVDKELLYNKKQRLLQTS